MRSDGFLNEKECRAIALYGSRHKHGHANNLLPLFYEQVGGLTGQKQPKEGWSIQSMSNKQ